MAANASKTYLFRVLNKRNFASAAPNLAGHYNSDVNIETLSNKTVVASVDSALPISRLSVVIKAGSKYDPPELQGLSHVLRSSAGLTTSGASTFAIIRNIQQIGGNIQVTGGRDTIIYTLESTCDNLVKGLKFLKDVIVNQVFKPWELQDNIPRIKYELAQLSPQARLVDLLHKAAYRHGYGNSLFVKEFNIGKIGSEELQHHVSSLFLSSRAAVVGVGINHDIVSNFAEDLDLPVGSGPEVPTDFYGGEVSLEAPTSLTHTGIVAKAAGLKDKETLPFAVLTYVFGGWSNLKWSLGNSPLVKVATHPDIKVSAFNAVHADSGIFGVIVSAPYNDAKKVLFSATEILTSGTLVEDVVKRAKNQLKNDILHNAQNGEELGISIAKQIVLLGGAYKNANQIADEIDKLTSNDVSSALHKFVSGKKALATYGNLSDTPYLDEF